MFSNWGIKFSRDFEMWVVLANFPNLLCSCVNLDWVLCVFGTVLEENTILISILNLKDWGENGTCLWVLESISDWTIHFVPVIGCGPHGYWAVSSLVLVLRKLLADEVGCVPCWADSELAIRIRCVVSLLCNEHLENGRHRGWTDKETGLEPSGKVLCWTAGSLASWLHYGLWFHCL